MNEDIKRDNNHAPVRETIVTGQQIGLLGGPLYTAFKVLGAVYHARQIDGQAVYWLETNDADFNEINHIDYLDHHGQLRRLQWNVPTGGYSSGYIEIDNRLVELIDTFFATIRQTEFTPILKSIALESYVPGRTLGEASETLASRLFGDFDRLLFFNPHEKEFREFSQPILRAEAERTPPGQQCNCFCMIGKQRKALFTGFVEGKGGKFQLRDGTPVDIYSVPLVPNVRTRNVCQDAYFRTHSYIAGPGEVKYLSQMEDQYNAHDVRPANVQPRMSLSFIEPRVKRLMQKTGLTLNTVLNIPKDDLIKIALKENAGFDFGDTMEKATGMTRQFLQDLEDLGLEQQEMKLLRKTIQQEIKQAIGKRRAREKEKHKTVIDDTAYLSDNLLPNGNRHERVFNIFYYMNLYGGLDFIPWLYDHYDPERTQLEIDLAARAREEVEKLRS